MAEFQRTGWFAGNKNEPSSGDLLNVDRPGDTQFPTEPSEAPFVPTLEPRLRLRLKGLLSIDLHFFSAAGGHSQPGAARCPFYENLSFRPIVAPWATMECGSFCGNPYLVFAGLQRVARAARRERLRPHAADGWTTNDDSTSERASRTRCALASLQDATHLRVWVTGGAPCTATTG